MFLLFSWSWFFLSALAPVEAHEFHVSKLDLRHNTDASTLELTLHLFIDDLEKAMKKNGYGIQQLQTCVQSQETEDAIARYVKDKIKININQKPVTLVYLGKEEAESFDASYLYLEVKNVKNIQKIGIENRLMLEVFGDQKNMVAVYKNKDMLDFSIYDHKDFKREIKP